MMIFGRNKRMIMLKGGFTLVDLLIVITILIIFSVIAIPRITSYYTVKVYGVAQKLAADIRYAQQLAISRQVRCGLSFDPGSESYFVYEGNPATMARDPYSRGDLIVSYQTDDTFKGVDLVSTNFGNRIEFDPLGRPYDSGAVLLAADGQVLLQAQGESRSIFVTPNTGATRVQ